MRQLASSAAVTASYAARSNAGSPLHMSPLSSSSLSPRLTIPNVVLPSTRTLSHRLLDRPHDTSRNIISRGNTDTASSVITRQAAEHVPGHEAGHVTLPRVSPSQQLTGSSAITGSAVPPPRQGTELSVEVTESASVITQDVDRTSVPSAPVSPCSSGSCLSLFDSSTASSNGDTSRSSAASHSPTHVPICETMRQSSERTVTSGAVASSDRPQVNTRANSRQVEQVSTGSTVRPPATGHDQRRSSQPATNTTNRRTSQPSNGAATCQISQPSTNSNLRRTSQTSSQTSITARPTPQQAGTLQPVPPRSSVLGSRSGPRKPAAGPVTRQPTQHSTVRRPAPPNGTAPANPAPVAQRRQTRNKVSNSTTGNQPAAVMTNSRLPTTPGQLMRARRRSEISQEIAESLRRTNDES